MVVDKQAHLAKYARPDPPEEITYRFMIERFQMFLQAVDSIGVLVADEQKGSEDAIRKAHSGFQKSGTGYVKTDRVIETPFFVPSHWSLMLQIIDVLRWHVGRVLNADWRNEAPPPEVATYIEPLLDGAPNSGGKGYKIFP